MNALPHGPGLESILCLAAGLALAGLAKALEALLKRDADPYAEDEP